SPSWNEEFYLRRYINKSDQCYDARVGKHINSEGARGLRSEIQQPWWKPLRLQFSKLVPSLQRNILRLMSIGESIVTNLDGKGLFFIVWANFIRYQIQCLGKTRLS